MRVTSDAYITPEESLASLIQRNLNVSLPPKTLRMFIKLHWSKVSALSHAIHDQTDD